MKKVTSERSDTKMLELRNIPLTYKEGVYSVVDFGQDIDEYD